APDISEEHHLAEPGSALDGLQECEGKADGLHHPVRPCAARLLPDPRYRIPGPGINGRESHLLCKGELAIVDVHDKHTAAAAKAHPLRSHVPDRTSAEHRTEITR